MTVLFAGGENSEVAILSGSTTTDTTRFRSTYARCALRPSNDNGLIHTYSGELAAYIASQGTAVDYWYGFRYYGSGGSFTDKVCCTFSNAGVEFLRIYNANSTPVGTCTMQTSVMGAAWVDRPASLIAQPTGTPSEWTFHIKRHATLGCFQWWINGTLWYEVAGDTTGYFTSATRTTWGPAGSDLLSAVSEIVATSGDDSRVGMNCATLSYTGNGANTGWTGAYTDVAEASEDTSTVLTAASASLDSSFLHTNVPAVTPGIIVRAVIVSGKWRTGSGAPQNLSGYLRISGTNYANAPLPSAIQAVANVAGMLQYIWHLSPATGVAFTEAEVNALQPGMRSVA
jgi:hypothetical protein